jgi:predicted nucleic-acid-binding Zn-ribbon protein
MEKEKCKKCGSEDVVMVEYDMMHPDHYDGVSEIKCVKCGARFGRWSGKELGRGETEKRFGQKK